MVGRSCSFYVSKHPRQSSFKNFCPRALLWASQVSPSKSFLQPLIQDDISSLDDMIQDLVEFPFEKGISRWNETLSEISREQLTDAGVANDHWVSAFTAPGFSPDQVKVSLDGDTVTVTGNADWQSVDGSHKRTKSFSRSFLVPKGVKTNTLKSKMLSNGTMLVHGKHEHNNTEASDPKEVPTES